MEEQLKVLENDIKELIEMVKEERTSRKSAKIQTLVGKNYVYLKETDENKDYTDYKKLIDTLISNFRTYLRFREVKYDNEISIIFKNWCEDEINNIHKLMEDSKNRENYGQYRCLNYVYIKLLDELNSYSLRKPLNIVIDGTIESSNNIGESLKLIMDKIDKSKRMAQYEIIHGIFYKYMFKAIENEKINIIFYHNGSEKLRQFENMSKEERFKELFYKDIKLIKINRDDLQIILYNGSSIRFVYASDNARGYRYHYAIVDTNIEPEMYDNVIRCKGILFGIDKEKKGLKDNYNIEFIEM